MVLLSKSDNTIQYIPDYRHSRVGNLPFHVNLTFIDHEIDF